jgi:hypothetical protein
VISFKPASSIRVAFTLTQDSLSLLRPCGPAREPVTRLTLLDRLNLDFLLRCYLSRIFVIHSKTTVVAFFALPVDTSTYFRFLAAFPVVSFDRFHFIELTASIEGYPFLAGGFHCTFAAAPLGSLPMTVRLFRSFFIHFVNSWKGRLFRRHLICPLPHRPSAGLSSNRWILQPSFRLRMSPPEIADAFTPSYLSLGSSPSFVPPPGSICRYRILFGSALLALPLYYCFSLQAFRRRNHFSVSPFGGSFSLWAPSLLTEK